MPSCATVFRDELINFFPHNEDAKRLSEQTFLLSEFLQKRAPDFQPPKLERKAIVHGHCHHKSVMKMDDEKAFLKKMELDFSVPESGCCGMAGAFGFEKEHYDVSIKVGERVLLPVVRESAKDTLIITDGFSCREQVAQTTGRHALHLAEVIQMAMRADAQSAGEDYYKDGYIKGAAEPVAPLKAAAFVGAGALLLGGAVWLGIKMRKSAKQRRLLDAHAGAQRA